ncbi:MAG TPA: [Fe-S]-binding protein [Planctomycetaceae bacterium]|nr:[Fe-S]-binding protein [Planctomycetaceae bacterium]
MNETLPRFFRVRQHFKSDQINDVDSAVAEQIRASEFSRRIEPGQSVAIAVGSRGIARIGEIVAAAVGSVRALGGVPWIVPAMGSHGGATASGQTAVLAEYGITPERMGCEIRSSMEVREVGKTSQGVRVYFDANASTADHVIVINRIKPHTRICGPHESGLVKMMLIGLGKHRGAAEYHQAMTRIAFEELVDEVVPMILSQCPISLGLAIIENAYDQVAMIESVDPSNLLSREPELLDLARQWMPRLPFNDADLLIIDKIGKNISGSGMDTNVVGRKFNDKIAGVDEVPKIFQIYVRGLTDQSAGNAAGIGIAEYCRSDLVRQMDVEKTRVNCLTALHITAAAIPIHWETDREVLAIAAGQSGRTTADQLRWMWIHSTLCVGELMCSEAYWQSASQRDDLSIIAPSSELRFESTGQLSESFL